MLWILCVGAHPARECLVVGKQSGVVATLSEPRGCRLDGSWKRIRHQQPGPNIQPGQDGNRVGLH